VLTETGGFGAPLSLEIVPAGGGKGRVVRSVRNPTTDVAPLGCYACAWSADGWVVYFLGRDPSDQRVGVWSVPAAGGVPRLAVRFDDPSRPWHRFGFRVHGGRFYFTVGDRESDV
jgi:hypothetical protein